MIYLVRPIPTSHIAAGCHKVFAVIQTSLPPPPPNIPISFGCILWHNITWDVNWNLVKRKNLKPHKILQSYWYCNYLADFIYSCKQHNLTSNGYVTCLHHFTLLNRNFCCNSGNFPLPSVSISKPTAMAIGSKRYRFFHTKMAGKFPFF